MSLKDDNTPHGVVSLNMASSDSNESPKDKERTSPTIDKERKSPTIAKERTSPTIDKERKSPTITK